MTCLGAGGAPPPVGNAFWLVVQGKGHLDGAYSAEFRLPKVADIQLCGGLDSLRGRGMRASG